jgi:hypothetical protein
LLGRSNDFWNIGHWVICTEQIGLARIKAGIIGEVGIDNAGPDLKSSSTTYQERSDRSLGVLF